jgi:hypothetical protein
MRLDPKTAAEEAGTAADQSVEAAKIAKAQAKKAAEARARTEELVPDPHREMLRELAAQEQGAFLRIGPKRNRWAELDAFEEELGAIDQQRSAVLERINQLSAELYNEPSRHEAELADWLVAGSKGERPASRALPGKRPVKPSLLPSIRWR